MFLSLRKAPSAENYLGAITPPTPSPPILHSREKLHAFLRTTVIHMQKPNDHVEELQ